MESLYEKSMFVEEITLVRVNLVNVTNFSSERNAFEVIEIRIFYELIGVRERFFNVTFQFVVVNVKENEKWKKGTTLNKRR